MKITIEKLQKWNACSDGRDWFLNQKETSGIKLVKILIDHNINWANWLVVRLMSHKQNIQYAIFAAEQVIDLYEKKYPDDNRPRKAIEAAKTYLKHASKKNKEAANAAAYAANAAADAAYAAADAANAAVDAADAAAYAAAYGAAVSIEMKKRIILYGIKLLK